MALWFAFLWGAGASVVIALLVDITLQISTASAGGLSDFESSVIPPHKSKYFTASLCYKLG